MKKKFAPFLDVLESLERGEMKFEATSGASSCSEDEDEDEEVDPLSLSDIKVRIIFLKKFTLKNNIDIFWSFDLNFSVLKSCELFQIVNSPTVVTVAQRNINSNGVNRTSIGQASQIRTQVQSPSVVNSNGVTQRTQQQTMIGMKRTNSIVSSSSPQETEYILPDSTMTEISLQVKSFV